MLNINERLICLEEKIGHTFSDRSLLREALTHSSFANEQVSAEAVCNERLEFLGDAVLELISSDFLFKLYQKIPEGQLSMRRAAMVCEKALFERACDIGLQDLVLIGRGEQAVHGNMRPSILSDCLEAVIGAIYLDAGFDAARAFVLKYVLEPFDLESGFKDNKSRLQELAHTLGLKPEYECVDSFGPDHNKSYEIEVRVGKITARATAHSKKAAEIEAAGKAFELLSGR